MQPERIRQPLSLLVLGSVPPPTTGASVACETLLRSRFSSEFRVKFINCVFVRRLEEIGKFSINKVSKAAKYLVQFVMSLLLSRIDIVIQSFASRGWALLKDSVFALICTRLFRRPLVLWMHGNGILGLEKHTKVSQWLIVAALQNASCVVVLGERLKGEYLSCVRPDRLRVIQHGIVPSIATTTPPTEQQVEGEIVVLYFSNMIREKDWLVTLEAARAILSFRRDVRFVFCGGWWPLNDERFALQLVSE